MDDDIKIFTPAKRPDRFEGAPLGNDVNIPIWQPRTQNPQPHQA